MDNRKLSNHYYSPQGYWKGYEAIDKLADVTNIDKAIVKNFAMKSHERNLFKL